jgi:hypothetical protein
MPELDRRGLENEFNINTESIEPEIVDDEGPDPFELEWEQENEDAEILRKNIERANIILDQVTEELTNGNFSARIVEVASNLINSITTASKVLMDDTNYNKYIDIRKSLALLKKREVDIKELKVHKPAGQNNLIIASREDVLRIINQKQINDAVKSD